jgi:elongation factor Ts
MITTEQLKTLRDETGISVMQCKKALEEAGGDIEKARVILKKKSGDVAAKKADRELGAGIIVTAQNGNKAVMLTLLSETDFVAKNDDFVNMAKSLADKVLVSGKDSVATEAAEGLNELMQKVGENIKLGEIVEVESANAGVYNHNGHFASVVVLKEKNTDLAKDIAMHATAMRPTYMTETDIPDTDKENAKAVLAKEVEEQAAGKPEDMKAKILDGKIASYFKEQILLNQTFIKDPSKTIAQLLKEANNEIVSFKIQQI